MSVWPGGLMADYTAAGHLLDITGQQYSERLTDLVKIVQATNWDEFLAACETVKKAGITPIASGFKDEISFSDKDVLEVFQKCGTLLDTGYYDKTPLLTGYNLAYTMFYRVKLQWLSRVVGLLPHYAMQQRTTRMLISDYAASCE